MIALKNNLPLLRKPRGHAVAFRRTWLRNALKRAAERAGYAEWWLADDLTQSVVFYLEHHYLQPIIAVPLLENAVRSALREIGYQDAASCFGAGAGFESVSLLRFLESAPRPDPARFFENLRVFFKGVGATRVGWIAFGDLGACVERLARENEALPFHEAQSALQTQIVEFIHAEVSLLHAQDFLRELRCAIR